jgi:hypothetical protein
MAIARQNCIHLLHDFPYSVAAQPRFSTATTGSSGGLVPSHVTSHAVLADSRGIRLILIQDTGFEEAAASWLSQGIGDITKLSAAERASFNVPHVTAPARRIRATNGLMHRSKKLLDHLIGRP